MVAENAGAIQTLHTGFQYPYQEPSARSFTAVSDNHYQKMRGLARLLFLQAEVDAGRGDWYGALNTDLDAVQLGETMPHGGSVIGMLVGVACQSIGRKQAWEVPGHLNAAQARVAARRLESIRAAHVPFADTLQEEEWGTQAGLLELMSKPDWPGNLMRLGNPVSDSTSAWADSMGATRIRLAGKRTIMANYMHYMDQSIANARQPYAAHPPTPLMPTDPVNQTLLPVFAGVRLTEVKADTQNSLLLVTLALRSYKLDHGAYPATLTALAPHYLQAVPTDPFALSGPLRYKLTGAKYLLYSIGPDGKDDGGTAIFDRTKPAPMTADGSDQRRYVQQDSQGDIVAGVNIS